MALELDKEWYSPREAAPMFGLSYGQFLSVYIQDKESPMKYSRRRGKRNSKIRISREEILAELERQQSD